MSIIKKAPAYVLYKMGKLLDQNTATLDPLGLDQYFVSGSFSEAAMATDSAPILALVARVVVPIRVTIIDNLDEVEAMAAARDLNMFASAVTRFGVSLHQLPHLEELLLLLAEKTCEVPTDTVFGYGTRNPKGQRQRSFTKSEEESLFIDSFSSGMNGLMVTLAGLEMIQDMNITHPRFVQIVREASQYLRTMEEAILAVRQKITPEFFTNRMRPFFDPKVLQGNTYFAAGGAQMPVTMIDLLLWGVEDGDRAYVGYRNENARYLPRSYRSKVETIMTKPSILRSVAGQLDAGVMEKSPDAVNEALIALREFADQMIRFRGPHLGIAKANMRMRTEGSVGSGGYTVSILEYLIKATKHFKVSMAC